MRGWNSAFKMARLLAYISLIRELVGRENSEEIIVPTLRHQTLVAEIHFESNLVVLTKVGTWRDMHQRIYPSFPRFTLDLSDILNALIACFGTLELSNKPL